MKQYKAYCFDLDGTVYKGSAAIPSAITYIHRLQQRGIEPFYVTNNSSKTPQQLQDSLRALGIEAPQSHLYSSAMATAEYVKRNFPNALVGFMGSTGLLVAAQQQGLNLVEHGDVDVFMMGIDRNLTYETLSRACLSVQRGAVFIATNGDVKFPNEHGFVPGNGSLARLVESVTDVAPIYIGKPSPVMLELIAQTHGFAKEDMVMIGDNYDTDILSGIRFGIDTIHVNTGVTPAHEVFDKQQLPTVLVENMEAYAALEQA